MLNKTEIISRLQLQPHPEGGYFRRSFTHQQVTSGLSKKPLMSCIYYLLTDDEPLGHLHVNRSDIMHFYHCGGVLEYTSLSPDGQLEVSHLGLEGDYQLLVPGGFWKTSRLVEGEFALISEAVAPGFEYSDMQMISAQQLRERHPDHYLQLHDAIL